MAEITHVFLVIEHGLDHPECGKDLVAVCTSKSKAHKIEAQNSFYRMVNKVPVNKKLEGIHTIQL